MTDDESRRDEKLAQQIRHEWERGEAQGWPREDIACLLRLLSAREEKIAELRATLEAIQPAFGVLQTMLISGNLRMGAEKARQMSQWVDEALATLDGTGTGENT